MIAEPIVVEFGVAGPPEHAFQVWTQRFSQWWPSDHTVSGHTAEIVLETRLAGRIFERTPDGVEHHWGTVTQWEPPHRLAYDWHIGSADLDATQVEVVFLPGEEAGRTTVRVTHRGWDRFGPAAEDRRDANTAGWNGVTPHFVAACERHRA